MILLTISRELFTLTFTKAFLLQVGVQPLSGWDGERHRCHRLQHMQHIRRDA